MNVSLASHFKLSSGLCPSSIEEKDYMSRVPYANTIGCLMYAMVCTRHDISHPVGVVSKYMEIPGKEHWNVVKWVLRYLRGTSDYCINFNNNNDFVCILLIQFSQVFWTREVLLQVMYLLLYVKL